MNSMFVKKCFIFIVTLCMIASIGLPSSVSAAGTTYYVDSVNGNDANTGTSTLAAWKTLSKVNATVFNPGDTILFKTGGVWNGQLSPQGSGTSGNPIVIDMYGTGSKPIINGGGLNDTGTVYLVNQEYWEINNLEITNDDDLSTNNTTNVRMGIYYKIDTNIAGNNRVFNHIYIRNCYIHDVDGNENGSAAAAGISGEIVGPSTSTSARFNDIRIENNTFNKVDRTAIQPVKLNIFTCPGTDTCFRDGVRNNNQWSTGVYIAYNTMNDIGGDGILMRETKDAIVEHNVLSGFGTRVLPTVAIAGIWLWNANHTVFQYNEVSGGPASNQDGTAFDFDYYGIDNVYQYNYSHDNPMGTILLMGANENDIFRYNISENDGMAFRHFAYNELTPAYIYNNIFYYDGANHRINGDSSDATKLGYHFYNNIFYNTSTTTPTKWGGGNWDQLTFSHNIIYEASGLHTQQEPFDPYGMTDNPKFVNPGSGGIGLDTLQGYKLQADSPAIDAGIASPEAEGIKDFFGTTINASKPDIGVQELTGTPAANSTMRYVPQQHMSVVATSSTTGNSPMMAVDGQDQTYWQSEGGSNPSLTIALGGTYNIDRVIYVPSADDAAGIITNYQVYTSTDGEVFTKVATGTWANNTYRKRAVFPSVSASYIKIIALHSSGHTSAAEVQVGIGTGTDGSGLYTTISQSSMTATASSAYSSSYAAALAIDGSTSTYWYPSSLPTAASPQYIILTLNQSAAISKFDYKPYSGAYAVTAYKLYVSTDGVSFTAMPTGTGNPGTWAADSTKKVAVFDPVDATAFKFEMTATGGNRPAVVELNLYSPDNAVPVPAQPTNLTASPMNSQVNLMWSTVTDATSYIVKRSTSSGGPYTTIAADLTGATYSDTDLANGTTYYYVVTAVNSGGESSNSKEVNVTPVQAPTAPTAPTNLTAIAGDAQVSLTWGTVTGATYYNVKRSTSSGGSDTTIAANVTGVTYSDTGLANGTTYYYVVTAANSEGESENSNEASATPAPVGETDQVTSTFPTGQGALVNLVDGDMSTSWASGLYPSFPGDITIDYGTAKTFNTLTISSWFSISQGVTNVDVEYEDGGEWVTAAEDQNIAWSFNDNTVEHRDIGFNTITASKIRLKINAANTYWGNFAVSELSVSEKLLTPPSLTADMADSGTAFPVEVTFTDDPAWRAAIIAVKDGASTLTGADYTVSAGKITIGAGKLSAGSHSITIMAAGYHDAALSQTVYSSNADLSGLTLSSGTLNTSFEANRTAYTASVSNDVSSLALTPTVSDATYKSVKAVVYDSSGMQVFGPVNLANGAESEVIPLNVGNNRIVLTVTAQDDITVKAYTVTVTRKPATIPQDSSTSGSDQAAQIGLKVIVNGEMQEGIARASTLQQEGQTIVALTIDASEMKAQLAKVGEAPVITITVTSDADKVAAELNGDTVKALGDKRAVLEIQTPNGSYRLPAAEILIGSIAKKLGEQVQLADIAVHVEIAKSPSDKAELANNAAEQGDFSIVALPVDFTVTATFNGKAVEVEQFSSYVERVIPIPDDVDPGEITTAIVLHADGSFHHVPTSIMARDGKYYALVNSLTNSTYALIRHQVAFTDMGGHWANAAVNDMASRLVINGVADNRFQPNTAITRAEFAAIIVRALGLAESGSVAAFSDVESGDWYAGAVAKAHEYEIVEGYEDGTFRPSNTITRQEAMVMIARAMKRVGLNSSVNNSDPTSILSGFTDGVAVDEWAEQAVAAVVKSQLVIGSDTSLNPSADITRAETAVIIWRMLKNSKLIGMIGA